MSLRPEHLPGPPFAGLFASAHKATRGGVRLLLQAAGWFLIVGGLLLELTPIRLGIPMVAVGVIVLLRNSYRARRQFIHLQRRHPRFVFPVRRLIRREPEVAPVALAAVPSLRADDHSAELAPQRPLAAPLLPPQTRRGGLAGRILDHVGETLRGVGLGDGAGRFGHARQTRLVAQ